MLAGSQPLTVGRQGVAIELDIKDGMVRSSRLVPYNLDMDEGNNIKLVPDIRNGSYILLFILKERGEEKEIHRMVFKDKDALLEFKEHFITVLNQVS